MGLPSANLHEACREIIENVISGRIRSVNELNRVKLLVSGRYKLRKVPSNTEVLAHAKPGELPLLLPLLKKKKVRTISGIAVVAVMTRPFRCPHGRCIYCPGGPNSVFGDTPQSYTGMEPAARRALENDFSPSKQVRVRLRQLIAMGHPVDKVKLVIMGGTFLATPPEYRDWFVKECIDAIANTKTESLEEAKRVAETAQRRIVGITIETRPDYCREEHVDAILRYGGTKVEIGVQTLYDDIYRLIKRGHTVEDVVRAFRVAKDAGLKVVAHVMPQLPGSDYHRDLRMFRMLFEDERFRPDGLKIYPCLVLEGTELYELWRKGVYKPYPFEELVELLIRVKTSVIPRWVRIFRVQRDIPSQLIVDGVKRSDLRELVLSEIRRRGMRCRCIRCREVGHVFYKLGVTPDPEDVKLYVERYFASEGEEVFISYEDFKRGVLIGFLRLRKPSGKAHRKEITENSVIVRELHVYGPMAPLGRRVEESWQHRGFGTRLLREAERIAREEFDARKILVISGIGVREYYYKRGYRSDGVYVSKPLV